MSLVKRGFIGLILLPAAEITAFIIVAFLIGWAWTICLFLATTALGILILRRSGRSDLDRFRAALAREGIDAIHLDSPGLGSIIAGILLVLPGFITDIAGLLLFVPAVRRAVRAAMRRAAESRRRQRDPSVIDLTPQEWHQVSDKPVDEAGPRNRVH
jgi:UPF0716 protein FxsA